MKPRPTEWRVVDAAMEVAAGGDVTMVDAEPEGESAGREEEARNRPEEARESGITRAVELQDQITKVIERHMDAFAWSASDMPGIDPDFLCHHLAMDTQVRPVRQRRRKFNEERRQAIRDETQKLLATGDIREVQYKACPKDSYPLPSIDALVDSAARCKLLSFLDAFSREKPDKDASYG